MIFFFYFEITPCQIETITLQAEVRCESEKYRCIITIPEAYSPEWFKFLTEGLFLEQIQMINIAFKSEDLLTTTADIKTVGMRTRG